MNAAARVGRRGPRGGCDDRGGAAVVVLAVALMLALAVIAWLIWLRPPPPVALTPAESRTLQAKLDALRIASEREASEPVGHRAGEPPGAADRRETAHRAAPLIDLDAARPPLVDLDPLERRAGDGLAASPDDPAGRRLEVYAPDPSARRIEFTERELNALIDHALSGHSTSGPEGSGDRIGAAAASSPLRMRVRLSPDQVSLATWLDFGESGGPFGLRRLRIDTGLRMVQATVDGDAPRAELVGISVGGVPIPRRWLDALFGPEFSQSVMAPLQTQALSPALRGFALGGVERLEIEDGRIAIQLAE